MPRSAPLLPAVVLRQRRFAPSWAMAMSPVGRTTPSCRSSKHGTPYSHRSRPTPSSNRRGRGRRVQFASPAVSVTYEITPYEEFYGLHPSQFNFDASGAMTPLSPDGMAASPMVTSPIASTPGGASSVEMIPSPRWVTADASPSGETPKAAPGELPWIWRHAAPVDIGTPLAGIGRSSSGRSHASPSTGRASSTPCLGFGSASPLAGLARASISLPTPSKSPLSFAELAQTSPPFGATREGFGGASQVPSQLTQGDVEQPCQTSVSIAAASVSRDVSVNQGISPLVGTPLAAVHLGFVSLGFRDTSE